MITLFHVGPRGFNVGNGAISLAMSDMITRAFGTVVNIVSLPATSRYEVERRAGLTARTIHEINQFGDGVIVGGGNLYENGELEVDVDALERLEPPLLLFSLSWGRIYNRNRRLVPRTDGMPASVIRALNGRATASTARDEATLGHLCELGLDRPVLGGCPTMLLDRVVDRLPNVPVEPTPVAFVSVRNPSLMNVPLAVQASVPHDVRAIARWLAGEGFSVRLLCHDHRDIPFAASFGDLEWSYVEDVPTYLSLLRGSSMNVTYRLHSAIPCLAFGVPFINLSYDERSLSLMQTAGMGDWDIDLVRSSDVLGDVVERYSQLGTLGDRRAKARPQWDECEQAMMGAFDQFVAAVAAYRGVRP